GRSVDVGGGTWIAGSGRAQAGGRLMRLHFTGSAELFGLRYSDPFGYSAYGATLRPQAVLPAGGWALVARGELTRGAWRAEVHEASIVSPPETGALSVTGGALDAVYAMGRAAARFGAEAYRS